MRSNTSTLWRLSDLMRFLILLMIAPLAACGWFKANPSSSVELAAEAAKLAVQAAEAAEAEAALQPIAVDDQVVDVTPAGRALISGQTATPNVSEGDPGAYPLPLKAACQTLNDPTAAKASGLQFLGGQGTTEVVASSNRVQHQVPLEFQLTREAGDAPISLLYEKPDSSQLVRSTGDTFETNVVYEKKDGTIPIAVVEAECRKKGLR